jgi:hypothetical protein
MRGLLPAALVFSACLDVGTTFEAPTYRVLRADPRTYHPGGTLEPRELGAPVAISGGCTCCSAARAQC